MLLLTFADRCDACQPLHMLQTPWQTPADPLDFRPCLVYTTNSPALSKYSDVHISSPTPLSTCPYTNACPNLRTGSTSEVPPRQPPAPPPVSPLPWHRLRRRSEASQSRQSFCSDFQPLDLDSIPYEQTNSDCRSAQSQSGPLYPFPQRQRRCVNWFHTRARHRSIAPTFG